jgi:hypothetical protein
MTLAPIRDVVTVLAYCLLPLVAGCPTNRAVSSDCDQVEQTRCAENTVEICNSAGRWELVLDCAEVALDGSAWTCAFDADIAAHTCAPPDSE